MLKQILVTNPSGEWTNLELANPASSGFIVLDVDGLGPSKSNITIRENTVTSGGVFNSARMTSRNIVFTLRFLPTAIDEMAKPTIENTRLNTYRYFASESRIRLDVTTDAGTFYIYGYVESNDPSIFTDSAGAVISVICPDPYFRTMDGIVTGSIGGIEPELIFPFHSDTEDPIIFGKKIYPAENFLVPNAGTSNIGPTLFLYAVGGQVVNPRISFFNENDPLDAEVLAFAFTITPAWITGHHYLLDDKVDELGKTWKCISDHTSTTWNNDVLTKWVLFSNTPLVPLDDGDFLVIVCEKTNKSVYRYVASGINAGKYLNYIGAVTIDSAWPVLRPGNNRYSYSAVSGLDYIRFGYEFTPQYIGV